MPITLTPAVATAQIVRVYAGAADAVSPPDAEFTLEWKAPRVVWVYDTKGRFCRSTLREALALIVSLGIHTILLQRSDAHFLPGVTYVDDAGAHHIDVTALAHRFARPGASDWAGL